MTLAAALRSAVTVVRGATESLQETVELEHYAGDLDSYSSPAPGPRTSLKAMVQRKRGTVRDSGGNEVRFRAIVTFVGPQTIRPRDRIILAAEQPSDPQITGELITPHGGLVDPLTGGPFVRTVYVGG